MKGLGLQKLTLEGASSGVGSRYQTCRDSFCKDSVRRTTPPIFEKSRILLPQPLQEFTAKDEVKARRVGAVSTLATLL